MFAIYQWGVETVILEKFPELGNSVRNLPMRSWNAEARRKWITCSSVRNLPMRSWNVLQQIAKENKNKVRNLPMRSWNNFLVRTGRGWHLIVRNLPMRSWNAYHYFAKLDIYPGSQFTNEELKRSFSLNLFSISSSSQFTNEELKRKPHKTCREFTKEVRNLPMRSWNNFAYFLFKCKSK